MVNLTHLRELGEEIKRMDIELQEREKRFIDIVNVSIDWIWEVNEKFKYTFCSKTIQRILGYEVQDIIGKTPFDFMPPNEAKRIREISERIMKEGKPFINLKNWNISKDGTYVCLLTNAIPIYLSDILIGYRGVDRDITEEEDKYD